MSNELAENMNIMAVTADTTGPCGKGSYFEGVRSGLLVRVVQVSEWVCGYVKLPEGHPWREAEMGWDIETSVHGGITYQNDEWVGFDTNHYGDVWPDLVVPGSPINMARLLLGGVDDPRMWTAAEFMEELEKLAKEAADASAKE